MHAKPPVGRGNAKILDDRTVTAFADEVVGYLYALEAEFGIQIQRVAVDAPSDPKADGARRRHCEIGLDEGDQLHYDPDSLEFGAIQEKATDHLRNGGAESRIPGANQLWMLVGFALFDALRRHWECLEVFPQAIVALLGANQVHKTDPTGLSAQLNAVATRTN